MILDFLLAPFSRDMAVDLGTANTLVYIQEQGIVVREPSVVAMKQNDDSDVEVLAVGREAKDMIGRTPGNIAAIRPMKDGVIADFEVAKDMLSYFIRRTHGRKWLTRPRMIVCIPSGIREMEERAVIDAALNAGAREAYLIKEPMAAAIGAGLPIHEAHGNMVVDIGGGTTEVAVISLGGIVKEESIRVGGDEMDEAIVEHVKDKYNLIVGQRTAEEVKISIGAAYFNSSTDVTPGDCMEIQGRDLVNGIPKTITLTAEELKEALQEPVGDIVKVIKRILEEIPPEATADIMDRGIVLAGGGSLLSGLPNLISAEIGIPTYLTENPLDCIVKGTGKVLEELESSKDILINPRLDFRR